MKKWLQNIVVGRYGSDELSFTLLLIYLGICIFGIFCDLPLVQLLGLAIILWAFFPHPFAQHSGRRQKMQLISVS